MTKTAELIARAQAVLVGGVNSPVRAFGAVNEPPLIVREAQGAHVVDADGEEFIDYVLSWGALLLGHDHPKVRAALHDAVGRGTTYGLTQPGEIALAERIVELVPSVDVVRFVNSGTEATMSAVRLARAVTKRDLVIKFHGGYHGHADGFLVAAGSGVATLGLPDSPGVPADVARLTVTCPFNDADAVRQALTHHAGNVAAVIIEPVLGNVGCIPPVEGFLSALRDLTRSEGALLIFDEVMTGFRVHEGGAQSRFGIRADLTTMGKVIGGGVPLAAYGGRRDLMQCIAPAGPVYQAGTLSGNPLATAAGLAVLDVARSDGLYEALEQRTEKLTQGLSTAARGAGVPLTAAHVGSMWGIYFHPGPVTDFAAARQSDTDLFVRFHRAAREGGVLLPPSPFETAFVSAAHTDDLIDETIERLASAMVRAARG